MSYLYLIIPPVVIIISLSILLVLVSRRSGKILAEKERGEGGGMTDGNGKRKSALENGASGFNRFFLRILEKVAHNFKIFSLKIHNLVEIWLHNIKEKRARTQKESVIKENREEKMIKDGSVSAYRGAEVKSAKKMMSFSRFGRITKDAVMESPKGMVINEIRKEKKDAKEIFVQSEEKRAKGPMVSRAAVYPEAVKMERKDELEEILIERIASDPRDVEAYERLGDYYYDRRNTRDAVDCYKQVLKLSPVNRAIRVKLRRAERSLRSL